MYEYYDQKVEPKVWKRAKETLKDIYADIPETEGCMENIAKENGCAAWCCEHQNPSVFFSEFSYTWNKITGTWTKAQQADLFIRAVRAYFDKGTAKGCIFWDTESKLCQQHETRPYNCRLYGQTPEEDFKPRYERLKVLYPEADIRPQCGLVKSANPPTKAQIDGWFNEIRLVELDMGIHPSLHNDKDGGSYRSYHDHILLKVGNAPFLKHISQLRDASAEEQEKFIEQLKQDIQRDMKL